MTVNIKYCGGCNPRYDRIALVRRLTEQHKELDFVMNAPEQADVSVIVCGCSAACADVSDCCNAYGRFVLWSPDAWTELNLFLEDLTSMSF